MEKILLICTGNTCRSPMAESFLRSLLDNEPSLSGRFTVASAGISAYEGEAASREAASVMLSDWGLDISGHRSTALSDEHIEDSWLILTMTRSQRDYIISSYHDAMGKIFTLKEYAGEKNFLPLLVQYDYSMDIPDPYGRSLRYYNQCASEIRQAVAGLAEKLKKSR